MGAERSRWGPVAGFVLVSSANQMLWLTFAPITTGAADRLGVSQDSIGLLSEIFPLLYVVLAIPVGRLLARHFRWTLATGGLLTALGAMVRLGGGFAGIAVGQVIIAAAQPAVLNAVTTTASSYLTDGHRPLGIAIGSAGTFLGFIASFVLGGALGAGRLHTILLVNGAYACVGAVVLVVTLRAPPSRTPTPPGAGHVRQLWSDPVLRDLVWLVAVGFGVFVALTTWLQSLLKPAAVHASTVDTLLTVMVVAGVVGSVAIPPLVARHRSQPIAILISGLATILGCLLLAIRPGAVAGAIALPLIGLLLLPDLPVVLELAELRAIDRVGPRAGEEATALLWLAGNGGGIVVALVIQIEVGSPALAFATMAFVGLLAAPLAWRLRRRLLEVNASVPRSPSADRGSPDR